MKIFSADKVLNAIDGFEKDTAAGLDITSLDRIWKMDKNVLTSMYSPGIKCGKILVNVLKSHLQHRSSQQINFADIPNARLFTWVGIRWMFLNLS